jgi:acetyl esterase/lipase
VSIPIGYISGVAINAACVAFALFAPRWRGPLGAVSFGLGLVFNELPFLAWYLLVASTAFAFGQGDIRTSGGWAAVGGAVLVTAGLAVVARRGLRARAAVRRALDDGIGPLDAELAARLRQRRRYGRILFAPFPFRPLRVAKARNLRYGDAGRRNMLDVYHRRGRPAGAPVLVYFHGGGYFRGSKSFQAAALVHRLAAQGWVCVKANYRLRPAVSFPDHLVDAKKVIAWVRRHAPEYGADPGTLFVAGTSAGGHLATLCGLTPNQPPLQPGFESADTSVTAVVSLSGYYGRYYGRDAQEAIPSTPFAYPATQAPPTFVAHGDRDTLVPVATARRWAAQLRGTSTHAVVYAELPGGQHSFDLFHSLRFQAVVDGIEAFAAWVRSRPGAR